ncbi:MAG TPA: hypothetical protein PKW35_15660, partial [Nannocystaceae bacterium]|nr:hypothetical protein [Nannocystaceae bacterium]
MGHVRLVIGSVGDLEAILRALLGGRRRWSKARLEVLIERLKWVEVSVVGWAAFGEALSELRERTAAARLRWTLAEIARRAERSREHLSRLYNHAVVRLTVETAIRWGLALEMPVWISVPESLAVSLTAAAQGAKEASGAAQKAEAVAGQVTTARDAAAEARARASTRKEARRSSDPAAGQASAGGRCVREKSGAKIKAEAVYEEVGTMWAETAAGEAWVSPRMDVDGSTEVVAGQATAGEGATGVEEVAAAGQATAGEGATGVEEVSAAGHVTAGEGAMADEEVAA